MLTPRRLQNGWLERIVTERDRSVKPSCCSNYSAKVGNSPGMATNHRRNVAQRYFKYFARKRMDRSINHSRSFSRTSSEKVERRSNQPYGIMGWGNCRYLSRIEVC